MSGDDDYEYSNGADDSCQNCEAESDEEWHAYCADCFAEEQGWRPRRSSSTTEERAQMVAMPAPSFPGDERWKVAYMRGYREGVAAAKAGAV